ncbi:MAG: hypothetical protein IPM55_18875 [Acidobacteria bacterium]|nr:hypothetical protein [Acidobacteriota bacterium]
MNSPSSQLVFFLGGRDLEMVTIRDLLGETSHGGCHDKALSWGARASAYRTEIAETIAAGKTPVLIELENDLGLQEDEFINIDHHGARAGREAPTSLHQVFALLDLPADKWTRWHQLVAANDRGYIPEMLAEGATPEEIRQVRAADRQAQGITANRRESRRRQSETDRNAGRRTLNDRAAVAFAHGRRLRSARTRSRRPRIPGTWQSSPRHLSTFTVQAGLSWLWPKGSPAAGMGAPFRNAVFGESTSPPQMCCPSLCNLSGPIMKTSTERYRAFCSIINLRSAWERVEESDGCAGVDGITLERFDDNLEAELERLRAELLSETYAPLPLLRFMAPKAGGGQRAISVPAVRDRVAQHAAMAIVGPDFEAEFEHCSFAYRRGRSVQQALQQVERLREEGFVWVVDADIANYFDNVDHDLMLQSVKELVSEPRIVNLIEQWIRAQVYDGHQLARMEKGLPQGAPISPMLANLYLDRFDEQMLAGGQRLIRFADDFLVLCKSKPRAEQALKLTSRMLEELRLALNPEKTRITSFTDGFKFLGSTFVRSLCLTPPPGSRKDETAKADIIIPPPLPILRFAGNSYRQFNTALRDGLRSALVDIDGRRVP